MTTNLPPTEITEKIERAFEQFVRGEFLTAEESRADMANRKAEWLRNRQAQASGSE